MTHHKVIQTSHAPQAIGCYSQARQVGNLLFLSGQIGLDPISMEMVGEGFLEQLNQIFQNIQAVITAAGGNFSHIVKLTVFLQDLNDFAALNETMKNFFPEPYPARSALQVAKLPKGALVEIEAIAAF